MRDLAYKALQAREELTNETLSEPTIEAIAARINEKKEDIVVALEAITEPVSLYEPVYNDSGDTLYIIDQLKDSSSDDETWVEDIALKEAIKHLDEREKRIIDMRFFAGKTQSEVANEIGISQAQVSRLEKGALMQIRKQI
jgi:RNA polymerase sporulation-specific sigma factor